MVRCRIPASATLAAVAVWVAPPAAAEPDPAAPDGAQPVAVADVVPGPPPGPAPGPAPVSAAAPVDDGKVISGPPATLLSSDGVSLRIWAEDETQLPVPPLTTAISTRDYDVGGVFRGSITDSAVPPQGVLEVGYQIGCGIDMGTGPGVFLGGNGGGNASLGLVAIPGNGLSLVPNVGVTGGGTVTVNLKPGVVNTIPVTKKQFQGDAPRVSIRNFRVKIDGCVGESFIRSYAILTRATDERETILAWYGTSKAV